MDVSGHTKTGEKMRQKREKKEGKKKAIK